jgi:hypothetical protein
MRSKRMLMGAAVIGCLAAAVTSGAHAQETNMKEQLNARTGHQPAASARASGSIRQGQSADMNAQLNARTGGNAQLNARTNSDATPANGQFERRGLANESRIGAQRRVGASAREGRGYTEQRALRGEHGPYAREQRYGRGGVYARAGVDGGYRGGRVAYRERAVSTGVGVAAADSGYRGRRLYAYAPGYETSYAAAPRYSYATAPRYSYAPGYDIGLNTSPYYAPAWNTAYAGPYYDYSPGVSFGIGIGPVGIGFGPARGW